MSDEENTGEAEIGHNSAINKETAAKLKNIIDRIETLNAEKKDLGDDIKELYGEAKGGGFDVKVIRKIIAIRKLDSDEVQEGNMLVETYCRALGMESYLG